MAAARNEFDDTSVSVPSGAVFVAADEPLLIFPSIAAAESCLEAIDVEGGVYTAAYGPKGEPYRIRSERNRVVFERTDESSRPDELKKLLLYYLDAIDQQADPTASVDQLVAKVWVINQA